MTKEKLLKAAREAAKKAYAPYSKFHVGAAILTSDGKVFSGCNIENASFSVTICAERTALFKAVSEGYNKNDFTSIAIVSQDIKPGSPCGVCRQALFEFMNGETPIYLGSTQNKDSITFKLGELLPYEFKL